MVYRKSFRHGLRTALILTLVFCGAVAQAADQQQPPTVTSLNQAAAELGLQMLRPHIKIEPHRPYVMIVRDPSRLIPLGVDDVGPGDRVLCRLLDGNRIVLYTNYGDQSAPIQLAPDGSIESTQTVRYLDGNEHISAQHRDRYEGMYDPGPSRTQPDGFSARAR